MIVVSCNNCFYKGIKSYSCNECNNYSNHKLCKTANSNPSEPVRYGPSKYNPPPRPDKPMKEPFNPKQALLLAGRLSQAAQDVLSSPVKSLQIHDLERAVQAYDDYIFNHAITGETKENKDEIYAKELKAHALGFLKFREDGFWKGATGWFSATDKVFRTGLSDEQLYAEYLKTL
jgi:hypothetical protein